MPLVSHTLCGQFVIKEEGACCLCGIVIVQLYSYIVEPVCCEDPDALYLGGVEHGKVEVCVSLVCLKEGACDSV